MDRKNRKLAHRNFRTLTTASSKTAEDAKSVVAKVCSFMQNVATPAMGKFVTRQVSCKREEFPQRAARVDVHLLQAFQELGDVEDVAHTVVAHRYRDDARRRTTPPPKRARTPVPAAAGGGIPAVKYAVIHISDSEDLEIYDQEIRAGGAPSDSSE